MAIQLKDSNEDTYRTTPPDPPPDPESIALPDATAISTTLKSPKISVLGEVITGVEKKAVSERRVLVEVLEVRFHDHLIATPLCVAFSSSRPVWFLFSSPFTPLALRKIKPKLNPSLL